MQVISFHSLSIDRDTPFVLNIILQLVDAVKHVNRVFVDFNLDTRESDPKTRLLLVRPQIPGFRPPSSINGIPRTTDAYACPLKTILVLCFVLIRHSNAAFKERLAHMARKPLEIPFDLPLANPLLFWE